MSFFHTAEFLASLHQERELKLSLKAPGGVRRYYGPSRTNDQDLLALSGKFARGGLLGLPPNQKRKKPELSSDGYGFREASTELVKLEPVSPAASPLASPLVCPLPRGANEDSSLLPPSIRRLHGRAASGGKRGEESTDDAPFCARHRKIERLEQRGGTPCPADVCSWVEVERPATVQKKAAEADGKKKFSVHVKVRGKILQFDDAVIGALPRPSASAVKAELRKASKMYDKNLVLLQRGDPFAALRTANKAAKDAFKTAVDTVAAHTYDPFKDTFVINEAGPLLFSSGTPCASLEPAAKTWVGANKTGDHSSMLRFESKLLHQIDSSLECCPGDMYNVCSVSVSVSVQQA